MISKSISIWKGSEPPAFFIGEALGQEYYPEDVQPSWKEECYPEDEHTGDTGSGSNVSQTNSSSKCSSNDEAEIMVWLRLVRFASQGRSDEIEAEYRAEEEMPVFPAQPLWVETAPQPDSFPV